MLVRQIVVFLCGLVLTASQAQAALVGFNFSGTITTVNEGGQNGTPLAGGIDGIEVGDTFTGSFLYNTDDSGGDLDGTASTGLYFFNPTTTNTVSLNIDGKVFDTTIGSVAGAQTFDNVTSTLSSNTDVLDIFKGAPNLPAGWSVDLAATTGADILFFDSTGTALPSDALPTSFDSSDWEIGLISLQFNEDVTTPSGTFNNVYIEGTINLQASEIPEPTSLTLIPLSFVLWSGGRCLRRRRNEGR